MQYRVRAAHGRDRQKQDSRPTPISTKDTLLTSESERSHSHQSYRILFMRVPFQFPAYSICLSKNPFSIFPATTDYFLGCF